MPRAGIALIKDTIVYHPVEVAEFRIEEIPFDAILKTVKLMSDKLPVADRNAIISSWDNLREDLSRTSKRRHALGKMDIEGFPRQQIKEIPDDTLMEPLGTCVTKLPRKEIFKKSLKESGTNFDCLCLWLVLNHNNLNTIKLSN